MKADAASFDAPSESLTSIIPLLYVVFSLFGAKGDCEVRTADGRVDIKLAMFGKVYLMEIKIDGTAQQAMHHHRLPHRRVVSAQSACQNLVKTHHNCLLQAFLTPKYICVRRKISNFAAIRLLLLSRLAGITLLSLLQQLSW